MNSRVKPFADLDKPLPSFTVKPKPDKPIAEETIARIADENNFPSRQAPRSLKAERRKPRTYRTGRNQQFNAKATPETIERFYKTADETDVPLGEWLKRLLDTHDAVKGFQKLADERKTPLEVLVKQALDALERAGGSGLAQ
jgi:hypothetical protein